MHAGVIVVVQRFRYDLGLFVHLHALVTDGAFAESESHEGASVRWLAAPASTEHDLAQVLGTVHRRLGRVDDDDDTDDALAGCVQFSLAGPQRVGVSPAPPRPLEVSAFGMSLHAATVIDGRDRKRLERMCRYLLRPPFAHDAVRELPDGRVRLTFKSSTRTDATHVDLEPYRFLARLVGLVPPPRQHQVRYFGVFSNHHALRARIQVEPAAPLPVASVQVSLFDATGLQPWHTSSLSQTAPRARARLGWASLLARVFSIDVSVCSRCGGQLRVIAAITDAHEIARLLHGARPPPRSPLAGQLSFFNT